jgi:hypothetical protein
MGMSDIKGARGLGCNIVAIAKQHTAVCLAAATLRAMNLKSARRTRTFTQSHHDLINKFMHARRLYMPIHLGTDPRNHVKHYTFEQRM